MEIAGVGVVLTFTRSPGSAIRAASGVALLACILKRSVLLTNCFLALAAGKCTDCRAVNPVGASHLEHHFGI
jgi:hypothetical protein